MPSIYDEGYQPSLFPEPKKRFVGGKYEYDEPFFPGDYSGTANVPHFGSPRRVFEDIEAVQLEYFAENPDAVVRVNVEEAIRLVRMGLQNLEGAVMKVGRDQIYLALLDAAKQARVYPPPPAAPTRSPISHKVKYTPGGKVSYRKPRVFQQYVRTYKLKRSVMVRRIKKELKAGVTGWELIVNPYEINRPRRKRYGKIVKGDQSASGQAKIHKGRWTTLAEDMIDSLMMSLPYDIIKTIEQLSPMAFDYEEKAPKIELPDDVQEAMVAPRQTGPTIVKTPKAKPRPRMKTSYFKEVDGKLVEIPGYPPGFTKRAKKIVSRRKGKGLYD